MTALETLTRTRERLSGPNRWRKNQYGPDAAGRCCLLGACYTVGESTDAITVAVDLLEDCVRQLKGDYRTDDRRNNVAAFNDSPKTKYADVVQVLDCAIAKASS